MNENETLTRRRLVAVAQAMLAGDLSFLEAGSAGTRSSLNTLEVVRTLMYAMKGILPLLVGSFVISAAAADKPFSGKFDGTGRACSGSLVVRPRTIEWNSAFSVCKPVQYEVLEQNFGGKHRRIVFRLKKRSSQCRFEVVEIEHASGYNWNVSGYRSVEEFQKRGLADWSNSPLPERQVLSCLMVGPN
ncbi:hypothetical protein [Paraburkholderia sp. HP33-1]|uniref:hypothetical protein n=1 Tax=Paraburkholderia sp. HP33-1 TaxID=2883243 RepID=UPI001F17D1E1|nr:hypothetical protein [Paraburkholderia sp. HP33-1]